MHLRWNCERRDAGRGSAPVAQATHYELTLAGDEEHPEATNEGDGYGTRFIADPEGTNELVGYKDDFTPGAFSATRSCGSRGTTKSRSSSWRRS